VTGEIIGSQADLAKHLGAKLASGGTLRTYRLAMAATGEYTSFHGGTKADALAAIVSTVNRVDGIYEREVSVRMVLVANDDLIIYTNAATDPYANTSGDLNANQSNTDTVIGSTNYDIGHLVGTGGWRHRGPRRRLQRLEGARASPARAHRSATATTSTTSRTRWGISSAATIRSTVRAGAARAAIEARRMRMSPAAASRSRPTRAFAAETICSRTARITSTAKASTRSSPTRPAAPAAPAAPRTRPANAIPTVTGPGNFTIPGRTPFALTASGADADAGDALTYIWEQFDLGAANAEGVLVDTVTSGPIFRSFAPATVPTRVFPSLRYILNNANAVPATAPLPGTTTPAWMAGEVLPNANRTLNFRVTVRDNKAGGGGTNEASAAITVANAAGPFAITAPNTAAVSWASGSSQTVTWNVAGTTANGINTANVRITLSTDGGYTFPIELIASTPNDGSQSVTVPAGLASTQARVKVEAVGNVYFDISDASFTITTGGNTPPSISNIGSVSVRQGGPTATATVATIADAEDTAGNLSVAVSGAPPELALVVQNVGGSVSLSATALLHAGRADHRREGLPGRPDRDRQRRRRAHRRDQRQRREQSRADARRLREPLDGRELDAHQRAERRSGGCRRQLQRHQRESDDAPGRRHGRDRGRRHRHGDHRARRRSAPTSCARRRTTLRRGRDARVQCDGRRAAS
jgi:hypothetical protein